MFKKSVLMLALAFSSQVFAKGDQSGLLTELYATKMDYNMYMNKGSMENQSLTEMLENVHQTLTPYKNQKVSLTPAWTAPIHQTLNQFAGEFATENQALLNVFSNVDSTLNRLSNDQKANCDAVAARYSAARNEMIRVWQQRKADTDAVTAKLTAVTADVDGANGSFYVAGEWLQSLQMVAQTSNAARATYTNSVRQLDMQLATLIEDIRICFDLD